MRREVRVHQDLEELSHAAVQCIIEQITTTIVGGTHCTVVLSGGTTPRRVYELLGAQYRDQVPWKSVCLFWGDERYVPQIDPSSNYRVVQETLLSRVPIPSENVYPMPTRYQDPGEGARRYEETLRTRFSSAWPRFDLMLLGLGVDGHTASLFPRSPLLAEASRWVAVARAPVEPPVRMTLTLPVLNHARNVFFLVSGAEKASALCQAVADPPDPAACPASAVRPPDGTVIWWVDQQAATLLPKSARTQ